MYSMHTLFAIYSMHSIYPFFQEEVIESVKQEQLDGQLVDFAGDGKFDSPGQCILFNLPICCIYGIEYTDLGYNNK